MNKDVEISLIDRIPDGSDEDGNPIYKENFTRIHAERVGVKRSEFYAAMAAGIKPEITYRIYDFEYHGEKTIEAYELGNGIRRLNVIRTYPIGGDRLEIVCNDIAEAG